MIVLLLYYIYGGRVNLLILPVFFNNLAMRQRRHYLTYLLLVVLLMGCIEDPEPVSAYQPILMSRAQLESSVAVKEPRMISNPGKIYTYGPYILINELYKGVHIINNQNPESPVIVGFIQVPGNVDFAVKNNVIYVDNAVDLVAIDLSNVNTPQVTSRTRNAFPPLMPPDNLRVGTDMAGAPEDAIIIGWELKGTK